MDLSLISSGLIIGALYALIAIGFTMIFGVGGVLNLAHGGILTLGAYVAIFTFQFTGNPWLSLLTASVSAAIFGTALHYVMVRNITDDPTTVMILTFLVTIIIEESIRTVIGDRTIIIAPLLEGHVVLAGVSMQLNTVLMFVVSWLSLGTVLFLINYTEVGGAIIATSMSKKGAAIVGINSERVNQITWLIASGLAGMAGVFLMYETGANYNMGVSAMILAFSIVVLGGLGSIRGSIIGAYLVGFAEVLTTNLINPSMTGLSALFILVVILLVRPTGLYGHELPE